METITFLGLLGAAAPSGGGRALSGLSFGLTDLAVAPSGCLCDWVTRVLTYTLSAGSATSTPTAPATSPLLPVKIV